VTRIVIATDAWHPQINGVVTTLEEVGAELRKLGHEVLFLTPGPFRTVPLPSYPSIRLALVTGRTVGRIVDQFEPDAIHIATEGPIGHAVRAHCLRNGLKFTTSYHTQFPEYVRLRTPIPKHWTYAYLRCFHGAATRTLVATASLRRQLVGQGFRNVAEWSRGVDTNLFYPRPKGVLQASRPISMYVGRVAVEKNIEAFLSLDLPGSQFVVGDGPDLDALRKRYPKTHFLGCKRGEELACVLAAADVFVFPSRTDTFGLVMLEAMACGVPVAAYPVTGPIDVIQQGKTGVMSENLSEAVLKALALDGQACVDYARAHSWRRCAEKFISHLDLPSECTTVNMEYGGLSKHFCNILEKSS
jgi:glycosyltransferase involved in cell wall biosynthesis